MGRRAHAICGGAVRPRPVFDLHPLRDLLPLHREPWTSASFKMRDSRRTRGVSQHLGSLAPTSDTSLRDKAWALARWVCRSCSASGPPVVDGSRLLALGQDLPTDGLPGHVHAMGVGVPDPHHRGPHPARHQRTERPHHRRVRPLAPRSVTSLLGATGSGIDFDAHRQHHAGLQHPGTLEAPRTPCRLVVPVFGRSHDGGRRDGRSRHAAGRDRLSRRNRSL